MSTSRDGSRTHSQTKEGPNQSQFEEIKQSLADISQKLSDLRDLKQLVDDLKREKAGRDKEYCDFNSASRTLSSTLAKMI